jgi:hypothetical protein
MTESQSSQPGRDAATIPLKHSVDMPDERPLKTDRSIKPPSKLSTAALLLPKISSLERWSDRLFWAFSLFSILSLMINHHRMEGNGPSSFCSTQYKKTLYK